MSQAPAVKASAAERPTGLLTSLQGSAGTATLLPRPAGPPPPGWVRVRLTVAYDGRGFHGFSPQPGTRTVAGMLADSLERLVGHRPFLVCAGRTDTGVHAWGQVVSFDAPQERGEPRYVQRGLNRLHAPEVVVREACLAPADFDARRSARARIYRYTVLNREVPDPFLAATSWHTPEPLDLAALRLACDPVIGAHDFASFCRAPKERAGASLTRTVLDAGWERVGGDLLRFEIAGSAFCHQMVRSLVGTMVEMGRGRRRAGDMAGILRARDRSAAGPLAPGHGLCLWEVVY